MGKDRTSSTSLGLFIKNLRKTQLEVITWMLEARLGCLPCSIFICQCYRREREREAENGIIATEEENLQIIYIKSTRKKHRLLEAGRPRFNSWVGKILWSREVLPTPVFLSVEFHRQRNLVGYSPWVAKSWTWLSDYHYHFYQRSLNSQWEKLQLFCSWSLKMFVKIFKVLLLLVLTV